MIRSLLKILGATYDFCPKCGWWVQGCPHQQ